LVFLWLFDRWEIGNPIITDGWLENQIDAPGYSFQVNSDWRTATLTGVSAVRNEPARLDQAKYRENKRRRIMVLA
jgi:hypothetical protein